MSIRPNRMWCLVNGDNPPSQIIDESWDRKNGMWKIGERNKRHSSERMWNGMTRSIKHYPHFIIHLLPRTSATSLLSNGCIKRRTRNNLGHNALWRQQKHPVTRVNWLKQPHTYFTLFVYCAMLLAFLRWMSSTVFERPMRIFTWNEYFPVVVFGSSTVRLCRQICDITPMTRKTFTKTSNISKPAIALRSIERKIK